MRLGRTPFFVDDHAQQSGDHHEAFCPQCFVYVRSPREPARFPPGYFIPVKCGRCGVESVAVGQQSCPQCGAHVGEGNVLGPLKGVE